MASATPATLCSGDTNYSNLGIQLAQSGETGAVALVTLTTPLTAGNYIVDTVAWDGYEGRSTSVPPELSEKYYIEFVDAAGATVGSTGTTDELSEDSDFVQVHPSFSVTLTGTAVQMRFVQVIDFIAPGDLVQASCVGITAVPEPTTTTTTAATTTTTAPPPTTTTTAAPTPVITAVPTTTTTAVVAAEIVTAPRTLPVTGSSSAPLVVLGTAMIAGGAVLLVRARRLA